MQYFLINYNTSYKHIKNINIPVSKAVKVFNCYYYTTISKVLHYFILK